MSQTEDRATLARDPSADPEAGMGGPEMLARLAERAGSKAVNTGVWGGAPAAQGLC
jgi:hypothetical protein